MPRVTVKDVLECNELKTCSKCDDEKKIIMFSRMGKGYRPECKACDSKRYYADKAKKALAVQHKPSLLKRIVTWVLS